MEGAATMGIFRLNRDALYTHVDEGWLHLHGCASSSDVIGHAFTEFLVPSEVDQGQSFVDAVFRGDVAAPAEFSRRGLDGVLGASLVALQSIREDGRVVGAEGVCVDTAGARLADHETHQRLHRLHDQQSALMEVVRQPVDRSLNLESRFRRIAEIANRVLQTDHFSIWLLSDDGLSLRSAEVCESVGARHSAGAVLRLVDAPFVRPMLDAGDVTEIDDVHAKPEIKAIIDRVLPGVDLTSMLVAPIRLAGVVSGCACFAHVGAPRTWHPDERAFAGEIAEQIAQPISALERLRMLDELQETNVRLQAVMENIEEDINVIALDGTILWHNQVRGGQGSLAAGGKCWEKFERRDARCPHCVHPEVLRDGKPRDYETRLGVGSAYPSDWWVRAVPLRNKQGEIYAILESAINITERKKMESNLRQARKMEAIGQLAGGIAHDFNNLLQAIQGYTDMAARELPPSHAVQTSLEEVTHATARADALVRQLLTFSRRDKPQYRHLNLNQFIGDLSTMLARLIGEHIAVKLLPGQCLGAIMADEGQIEQIMINLCVNARDAMPQGGTLTIETANMVLNSAALRDCPGAKPGPYVMLRVSDTGVGMDAETQERMYEPFFTTKGPGQGTGLGLATVYAAVQQHRGIILHDSAPDEGTAFRVYFPRVAVESPMAPLPKIPAAAIVGGKETVLLAEDEEAVRNLALIALGKAGYRVLPARDGQEALDLFRRHQDEIGIVVLDVMMPLVTGSVVARDIRAVRPTLPILFSTGYDFSLLPHDSHGIEHIELLAKPYRMDVLLRKVRELIDRPAQVCEP